MGWIQWEDLKRKRISQKQCILQQITQMDTHHKTTIQKGKNCIWKQTLSIHFGDSFDGVFTRNNFFASVKINPGVWITRARQKGPKTLTKIYLFYKKPHPQNDNSQKKITSTIRDRGLIFMKCCFSQEGLATSKKNKIKPKLVYKMSTG